jgi:hypothetical protein
MRFPVKIHSLPFVAFFLGFLALNAPATTYYVNVSNPGPTFPYTSWSTASKDIQSAIDAANSGDTVLVTNGVYITGGETVNGYALTNRVVINKAIIVRSVNGPAMTVIQGYQDTQSVNADDAVRCIYLTNNAILSGFTLTNGATRADGDANHEQSGGGAWCESDNVILTNCILNGNAAYFSGGGVSGATLNQCQLTSNWTDRQNPSYGGGAISNVLNFCTLAGNFSIHGGGAEDSTLNNCRLTGNWGAGGGALDNCVASNCVIAQNTGTYASGGGVNASYLSFCVLSNNFSYAQGGAALSSTLVNCTLTINSAVDIGGGVESCILTNCWLINNYSGQNGGGASDSTLINCEIISNTASGPGGGANASTLVGCVVSANAGATNFNNFTGGGGLNQCIASYCTISNNTAWNQGAGANSSTLSFCTLNANLCQNYGGGAYGGTLNCCTLENNVAYQGGGGAYKSALTSCLIVSNTANANGGAADNCQLTNCTIVLNIARFNFPFSIGGAEASTLYNCIVDFNQLADFDAGSVLSYCCSESVATNGIRNITNNPGFVNPAGNNFHLLSNSPCINAGDNAYGTGGTDLDGNLRIAGGTVDIGAYEYQTPQSIISYAWLNQYGLPTDGSVDFKDLDGTAFNIYQDWIAGLNPTNPASILALLPPTSTNNAPGLTVSWQSVSGINYYLQRAINLSTQPAFSTIQSNITGQAATTSYTDTTATNGSSYFYRVGVQWPR